MADLLSFAELIRKGKEDARLKELQEATRKQAEVAPLLGDLFKTVAKSKKIVEKRANVVNKLDEIEASLISQNDVQDLVTEKLDQLSTDTEKKLLGMVQRLQSDIANLKKHVDTRHTTSIMNSSGGGEVRVLRMDDVDKTGLQDGAIMIWSAALNKFVFTMPSTSGSGTAVPEEILTKRIDFISDSEIYKGEATVGASETDAVWRIHKVTLAADGDLIEMWANGTADYDKRWSDHLTYTYL